MSGERTSCGRCGRALPASATFCGGCGHPVEARAPGPPVKAGRRRRRAAPSPAPNPERAAAERTIVALAIVFGGTLLALVAASHLVEDAHTFVAVANVLFLAVALGAALSLGPGGLRLSLAGRASPTWWALGLAAGLFAFAINWTYVQLWFRLVDASPRPGEPVALPLLLLEVAVLPALVEEWLCRGILWAACRRATSTTVTILTTAALFSLLHALGEGFVFELPHRFASGLVFGWLRARSGSLVPGVVAHFVNNVLAVTV